MNAEQYIRQKETEDYIERKQDLRMAKCQAVLAVIAALVICTMLLFSPLGHAQTNWVVCESIVGGTESVFPDSCPTGWVFVRYA